MFVNLGAYDALKKMYKLEGIRGLWRANVINSSLQASFSAYQFYFYEYFKNNLLNGLPEEEMTFS